MAELFEKTARYRVAEAHYTLALRNTVRDEQGEWQEMHSDVQESLHRIPMLKNMMRQIN